MQNPKLSQFKTNKEKISINQIIIKKFIANNKIWHNTYGAPEIGNRALSLFHIQIN